MVTLKLVHCIMVFTVDPVECVYFLPILEPTIGWSRIFRHILAHGFCLRIGKWLRGHCQVLMCEGDADTLAMLAALHAFWAKLKTTLMRVAKEYHVDIPATA